MTAEAEVIVDTVKDRMIAVEEGILKVKKHCMCAKFEDTGRHFMVYMPEGYVYDAVRIDYAMGKAKALEMLETKLEKIWKDSFI